ncbi:MAG: MoaD/ThiS family protein [Chloroflexi bacterium]|nr:MoaD/ThiS family protein [Chloroflexota bacterium]
MIDLEVWLYGSLGRSAFLEATEPRLALELAEGSTVGDLLARLGIDCRKRGLTFVNGELVGADGLSVDLRIELHDGDRVGIFPEGSAWPLHYRYGATISRALQRDDQDRPRLGHRFGS